MSARTNGSLEVHEFVGETGLEHAETESLARELLARLRRPAAEPPATYGQRERMQHLLESIGEAIAVGREVPENRFSLRVAAAAFEFVRHCWRVHGLPVRGAVHLDVGCGAVNPFARMFVHVLAGVREVHCCEVDPLRDVPTAVRFLARLAKEAWIDPARLFGDYPIDRAELLQHLDGVDLSRLAAGDPEALDARRMFFHPHPVEQLPIVDGAIDVVVSNSVLEHLPDVDGALAAMRRMTRPGGFGVHGIDVADHLSYGDASRHPLEFLTADPVRGMVAGCNRLRLHQFVERFEAHGFEVLDTRAWNVVDVAAIRARLVEPWRSMRDDQLDTTWSLYLVRRD